MTKLKVALLAGGISSERDISIKSGNQVYDALDKAKYDIARYDPATDLGKLVADASRIDVAFIVLHGPYGEDGTVQGLLDLLHIPYQGSGVLGSALAMDKWSSKRLYKEAGLPVPPFEVLVRGQAYDKEALAVEPCFPLVVKPRYGGSSIGTSIVQTAEQLPEALNSAFQYGPDVILEAYLEGTEIRALCCRGYSRTDMIIHDDIIYVLETNTIPGMTPVSLFPLAAKAFGISFSQLLDRLIELALEDRHLEERPVTT